MDYLTRRTLLVTAVGFVTIYAFHSKVRVKQTRFSDEPTKKRKPALRCREDNVHLFLFGQERILRE